MATSWQPKSKMMSLSLGQKFVWIKVSPSNFCTEIAACLYPSAAMLLELESAILFPSPSITKWWLSIQEQYLMFRRWNTNEYNEYKKAGTNVPFCCYSVNIWQFYPFESYRQIMTVLTSRRTTNFTIQLIWPDHTLLIRGKKFDVTGAMYTKRKLGFWNHSIESTICIATRRAILTFKADDSLKIKVNIYTSSNYPSLLVSSGFSKPDATLRRERNYCELPFAFLIEPPSMGE